MALWELPELGEDTPLYHGDSQRPILEIAHKLVLILKGK